MSAFIADPLTDVASGAYHPSPISHYNRLRWHSRRGMLELDILLQRFWEKFGDKLSAEDGEALEILLEYEDNDLLELILGDEGGESYGRTLQMLRAA
jgi:succinate dehydrogenase flavin-adding protein (antitoxin of CptAB toxin-antitoxin module)